MLELLAEIARSAGFLAGLCGIATLLGVFTLITLAEYGVCLAWTVLDWISTQRERSDPTFSLRLPASALPSQRP